MMYIGELPTGERLRVSGKAVEPIICAPRPPKESEVKSFQGSAQRARSAPRSFQGFQACEAF